MRSCYINVLVLFFVCSCCIQITEPINYQKPEQKPIQQTMQVSADWETLATDLANRINNQLILTGNLDKAVFVKETCGDENRSCQPGETSSFNEAFHDLLVTKIFGYGVPTESHPDESAIEVRYKVQVVHYSTNRSGNQKNESNCEVIITASMVAKDQYLFRSSNLYYINENDFYHYQENMPQTKIIKLSSGRPAKPHQSTGSLPQPPPLEQPQPPPLKQSLTLEQPQPLEQPLPLNL